MVNPDRLHNAISALDILARADSMAFVAGRADAPRGISHTFGKRLAAANARTGVPGSNRTEAAIRAEDEKLHAEGERRKNAKGAYPPDILKKLDKNLRERDGNRQAARERAEGFGRRDATYANYFAPGVALIATYFPLTKPAAIAPDAKGQVRISDGKGYKYIYVDDKADARHVCAQFGAKAENF